MNIKKVLMFLIMGTILSCNSDIDEEDLVCENPTVFFEKLNLSYSNYNGQNKIYLSKLECDICQIGVEGAEACDCRKECEKEANQIYQDCKDEDWWDECKERWEWETSTGDSYSSLENECCPESGSYELNCKLECGTIPDPIRVPIGYTYGVEIWTSSTTVLVTPPNTVANDVIVGDQTQGSVSSISFDIGDYLDSDTESFCIVTTLVVLYDDGKCCMFKDRLCSEL